MAGVMPSDNRVLTTDVKRDLQFGISLQRLIVPLRFSFPLVALFQRFAFSCHVRRRKTALAGVAVDMLR